MPYDDDDLTDPYEDELDSEFLSSYGKAGGVLSIESPRDDAEDEEDEGLWLGLHQTDEITSLVDCCRKQNVPLGNVERAVSMTEAESKRVSRREYNARYRAGLVRAARARPFMRCSKKDPTLVERRKMTYYLPLETLTRLKGFVKANHTSRREFCASALESWLKSNRTHSVIPRNNDFKARVFVFDEISSELWERIDSYCRSNDKKRHVRLYQVVEAALLEAMANNILPAIKKGENNGEF